MRTCYHCGETLIVDSDLKKGCPNGCDIQTAHCPGEALLVPRETYPVLPYCPACRGTGGG